MYDEGARQGLARRARTGRVDPFDVHRRAIARGDPEPAALPPRPGIVDAAVDALREEAHGIGHAQLHDLSVRERVERVGEVAGPDRRVLAEPEDVVLIDPGVVRAFGGAVAAREGRAGNR